MERRQPLIFAVLLTLGSFTFSPAAEPPAGGEAPILPLEEVHAGMKATAWTVFEGSEPEPIPVEILGVLRNSWGPGQHIIMAKLGGKAERTNVAAGMSGSPVYYDGKLLGAISLRFSTFSPDAVAGITPIELMLDIQELDSSIPRQAEVAHARFPEASPAAAVADIATEIWNSAGAELPSSGKVAPIETPLLISGAHRGVIETFEGYFRKHGVLVMQAGGGGGGSESTGEVKDPLKPGQPIAAVMISGDISASGVGTVTYNDGKRVLGFGHAMFNSGPIDMPIATAEVLTVLASKFAPVKIANSGTVVGALRQDRHSGIMGVLGVKAHMIPMRVKVRNFADSRTLVREKEFHYNVFQNQKWTPQLVVFTLFNSMFGVNDFAEESTFRLSGEIGVDGERPISFNEMQTVTNAPVPTPLLVAGAVGNKIQRLFTNVREMPNLTKVDVTIDLLPERQIAVIEHAWVQDSKVAPGETVRGKVFLRPYRGDRIVKSFELKVPLSATRGKLRLLVSDATTLNRGKLIASARNRLLSLSETVSLLNQERSNDHLYVSLLDSSVTAHVDDKTMQNVPLSVLNVLRETANQRLTLEPQSPLAETALPLDAIVSGSETLSIEVR